MPKGIRYGGRQKGTPNKKTIWLLESLAEHGFDYEQVLVSLMSKAVKGDRHALDMAHLLVKMVPYIANAPKQDAGIAQIETLVINRYDLNSAVKPQLAIDTTATEVDGQVASLDSSDKIDPLSESLTNP